MMAGLPLDVSGLQWAFRPGSPPFLIVESLTIPSGQTVAVTGPSGSGKTSLLFLLAGLEQSSGGRVRWGDTDLSALGEAERDRWRRSGVGLLFQDFRLVDDLTVLANVLLPTTLQRWRPGSELRARALALIERMGLTDPRQRVATLSRGEMQRTALARALLLRPPVVLADEPTASLDTDGELAVEDLLFDAARAEGATLLIATHHQRLWEKADRRIALAHGRVVSDSQGDREP
jgi:putative ABC transport system ATP-binding protein